MTVSVFVVVAGITALFIVLLVVKTAARARLCVICASVSLTWAVLLGMHYLYRPLDTTLIAVLMGGSAVGLYYLVERKTRDALHIFRLPFLLSLFVLVYAALGRLPSARALILVAALWALCGIVYGYRARPTLRAIADKIIACCKDW